MSLLDMCPRVCPGAEAHGSHIVVVFSPGTQQHFLGGFASCFPL